MTEEQKSENTEREERILDAAADLISHYGYDKTTVSDIAREAGVSKGAIYLHFSSKEDLFEALLEREIWRYGDSWLAKFEQNEGWTFSTSFKLSLEALNDSPFMQALLTRDQRILGSFLRRDSKLLQQKGTANAELYGMMQNANAARSDIDPQVIAHILNIFAYGLVSIGDIMPQEDFPAYEQIVDGLAKILDRGLAPEDGGNPEAGKALIIQVVEAMRAQSKQTKQPTDETE